MDTNKIKKPTFKAYGKQAILITWEPAIDENLLLELLNSKKLILKNRGKVVIEIIHTYSSLLVKYKSTINKIDNEISRLKSLLKERKDDAPLSRDKFTLPVCYDEEFGLDFKVLIERNKLSVQEIIDLHTAPDYTVFFTGFLPGFLYLGGLPKELFISRKNNPRLEVQKGAVGIGEKQTGIYPQKSAGGWQIIGNCPIDFFNPSIKNPTPFSAGDQLKFEAVSREEFENIQREIESGTYTLKQEKYVG